MNVSYLKDLGERVLASFAGGLLTTFGGDLVNVWNLDWKLALGVATGAAVISLLKGLAAKAVGNSEDPSLVK